MTDRREVNWDEPCELNTGEGVRVQQVDEHTVLVLLLEDATHVGNGCWRGVTIGARRKGSDSGMLLCNHAYYVRNKLMIKSPIFAVDQRVTYLSGTGRSYGTGIIKSISNNIITAQIDGLGRREFNLSGKIIASGGYDPAGTIEPIVTKRSGFILISTSASDARFFRDLAEASRNFHLSDGSYIICTCEQQADREGGEFLTVNISGPIEPLPQKKVRYLAVPTDGSIYITDSLHSHCNSPRTFLGGDNLKLTFEGDRLVGAEVVER